MSNKEFTKEDIKKALDDIKKATYPSTKHVLFVVDIADGVFKEYEKTEQFHKALQDYVKEKYK